VADVPARVAAIAAAVLGAAALAVSFSHTGPAGPRGLPGQRGAQGPAGGAGQSAVTAHLGVCWESNLFTQTWTDGSSSTWLNNVNLSQPELVSGVYTCPQGEQFVSIVPQAPVAGVNGLTG
jgi:hypothetical protein